MNPPKIGTKKYWKIVKKGCDLETTDGTDYGCGHKYDWECDQCPCCIESQRQKLMNQGQKK